MTVQARTKAPELNVESWLNTNQPLSIKELGGKVVVIHAFQMLCPGCVTHGLPQASAIYHLYAEDEVQVIGLHSVFEHHEQMAPAALKVFAAEFRLEFPIAVDSPGIDGPIPQTMLDYKLQGTPSLILIDQLGEIRLSHFGRMSDMQVGNSIGQLLHGKDLSHSTKKRLADSAVGCTI